MRRERAAARLGAMRDERRTPVTEAMLSALEALDDEVLGEVILPWSREYDRARGLWNGMHDRVPHAIVRPRGDLDVVAALAYARDQHLPVAVRGEEFAVLLPETDLKGGVLLADRLRRSLEGLSVAAPEGAAVQVTASFGVASYPSSATVEELLVEADGCLYRAKERGKNTVVASRRERHAASG